MVVNAKIVLVQLIKSKFVAELLTGLLDENLKWHVVKIIWHLQSKKAHKNPEIGIESLLLQSLFSQTGILYGTVWKDIAIIKPLLRPSGRRDCLLRQ